MWVRSTQESSGFPASEVTGLYGALESNRTERTSLRRVGPYDKSSQEESQGSLQAVEGAKHTGGGKSPGAYPHALCPKDRCGGIFDEAVPRFLAARSDEVVDATRHAILNQILRAMRQRFGRRPRPHQ
jgi:hypothetical protein